MNEKEIFVKMYTFSLRIELLKLTLCEMQGSYKISTVFFGKVLIKEEEMSDVIFFQYQSFMII